MGTTWNDSKVVEAFSSQYLLESVQNNNCIYVPDIDLQENHQITPPSKHPKSLSRAASLIEEKKKECNNSISLSLEETEVDRYGQDILI